MLKVAVNTRLLLPDRMEGIARFIHETTSRMVMNNPEVEFHFLFDRKFDDQFVYGDNVVPHVLRPPSRHPVLWYLWFEHSVYNFLSKNEIDVFYSGDMYLSLRSKTPTVYVSHDLNYIHYPKGLKISHLQFLKYYFPKYHKRADKIISVSNFTKKDIIKQYDIPGDKITVAYNDVPEGFKRFSNKEIQETRKRISSGAAYFIYIGSLHPRKNLESLLKAFDKFKAKEGGEIKLLIYGRIAFKASSIFEVYSRMNFKNHVVFIDNEVYSVQQILPAAHALCYPSLFEGFGIPILEAYKSGVPVLTSNTSSMPEVAGQGALLVNPNSVEDIANGMMALMSDDLCKQLISRSEIELSRFSWDDSAQKIFNQIKKLKPKP